MTLWLATVLGLAAVAAPALASSKPPSTAATVASTETATRPRQSPGHSLPLTAARHLHFTTTTGTWLSLDLTSDGRSIVFDMLGDLYVMPVSGGRARAITTGLGFDTQPTVSPHGKWIAFVSDRSGAENLWLIHPDGSGARQLSFGDDDTVLTSPAWSADGRSLYVSRYRPDLNHYELWQYGLDGSETRVVPTRDAADAPRAAWRSTLGAVASPDGHYLYAARHIGTLEFETPGEWTIIRRDLRNGTETVVVAEPDGPRKALDPGVAFRPALSPDGKLLVYARRLENATELRLRNLMTGEDRRIASPIEHDQLGASAWQDLLPRYAFTPDGQGVVLSRAGHFERLPLDGGQAVPLPFHADVDLAVGPSTRQDIREDGGPVRARLIMAPVADPGGQRLAFSAFGGLWLMPLGGGSPVPFTSTGDPAFQPSWSPDGSRLTWVTWSERGGGAVWTGPADGSSAPAKISAENAYYSYPVFTPDGGRIVAMRSAQASRLRLYMEYGKPRDGELVEMPAAGGAIRVVARGVFGSRPQFATDPNTVYVLADDGLNAVDWASGARRLAVQVKGPGWYFQDGAVPVDDLRISPDGKWLLAQVAQQLHLIAMPPGSVTSLDLTAPGAANRRITSGGADYFEWGDGGRSITWSSGASFHRRALADVVLNPPNTLSWVANTGHTEDFRAVVEVPRAQPRGSLLLSGARVLTMAAGERVLDDADILVTGDRIAAIGPRGHLTIPPGTTVRDVSFKTIIPGLIDVHDHIATVRRDVLGLEDWGLRARLAAGVTTSFDPSTLTIDMLAYQDLLDAGLMTGPRLRQTGIALFSMQRFAALDEVRAVLRRYRDDYGLRNIKEYRTGNRRVRQWVAIAARELGLQPTTEGALAMKLDLSQVIDGFAGNEHALVAAPLGEDVLRLMSDTRTGYTTTLQITNGGPPAEDWFIARDSPLDDPWLARFWPPVAIDQMMLARQWRPLSEYRFPAIAADAAALQRRGGLLGMGSHGEAPGLGLRWELEAHVLGGMTPREALHAATSGSAEHIGRAADLGSIEAGKLADLVICDHDPSVDLTALRHPRAVMKGGVLYDAGTLDELWPDKRALPPSWFTDSAAPRQYLPEGIAR